MRDRVPLGVRASRLVCGGLGACFKPCSWSSSCAIRVTSAAGICKDLYAYRGNMVNFEAFDFADVKILRNCQLNKLYFMQYYTELYINTGNPDLINKK